MQISTRRNRPKFVDARRKLQNHTRKLKSQWWEKKAEGIQLAAEKNDMKAFFSSLKGVTDPKRRVPHNCLT